MTWRKPIFHIDSTSQHSCFAYGYNAESHNPNGDVQYLRARYYSPGTANFLTEDSYLGDIADPLTLNWYNYVKSSPLNYIDPSGMTTGEIGGWDREIRDERREQLAGDSNGFGIADILKDNVDEYGRVHIGNIGTGKDRIALYMQIADETGEINWCQAAKQMVSFALGMEVENRSYWNSSDFQKTTWTQKLAKNLVDGIQKLLFGRSFSEYVEEKLVDQYLDPEMYYTGKYIVSLQRYVQSSTNKSTLDSVLEYLGDHASELYVDTVLSAVGAMAGSSGNFPKMGMAGGAAAGTVTIEGAGAAVLVVGKGIAAGVVGGAVVYFSNEDNLNRSLDHAEKNKEKIDKAKGDANSGHLSNQQANKIKNEILEGKDVKFKTKEQALEFIEKKFSNFNEEVAGNRSSEGWHFDSHPIGGSDSNIDHINIYSKTQGFRVHITWGD